MDAESTRIKNDSGERFDGDLDLGLQRFEVVVNAHGEDEEHGHDDAKVIAKREPHMEDGRERNVGHSGQQKSHANGHTAEPRNWLGVGVAPVDWSSLKATGDRNIPDRIGQESGGGDRCQKYVNKKIHN